MAEEMRLFKVLFDAEWKYRVNSPMRQKEKKTQLCDMNKQQCISSSEIT